MSGRNFKVQQAPYLLDKDILCPVLHIEGDLLQTLHCR